MKKTNLNKTVIHRILSLFLLAVVFSNHSPAQSVLWKISGNNLPAPSYLYGTIHLTDRRIFEWKDSVYKKLIDCEAFAGELDLSMENIRKAAAMILLPDGQTLHNRFTPEDYKTIEQGIKSCSGFDLSVFDRIKPPGLIALCFANKKAGDLDVTVDELLYKKATESQKIIYGIETIEEQMAVLDRIPDEYVLAFFQNLSSQQIEFEKLIENYRNANLDSLLLLLQDEESGSMLNDELIRVRNYRMTERVIPMISQHAVFIAIGCGHLPGSEGVIELLRKRGYRVEAVKL